MYHNAFQASLCASRDFRPQSLRAAGNDVNYCMYDEMISGIWEGLEGKKNPSSPTLDLANRDGTRVFVHDLSRSFTYEPGRVTQRNPQSHIRDPDPDLDLDPDPERIGEISKSLL